MAYVILRRPVCDAIRDSAERKLRNAQQQAQHRMRRSGMYRSLCSRNLLLQQKCAEAFTHMLYFTANCLRESERPIMADQSARLPFVSLSTSAALHMLNFVALLAAENIAPTLWRQRGRRTTVYAYMDSGAIQRQSPPISTRMEARHHFATLCQKSQYIA